MSAVVTRFGTVRRQLEAYGGAWQENGEAALRRQIEDVFAVGVTTFALLRRSAERWRERVFQGTEELVPEDEAALKDNYRLWLATTMDLLARVHGVEEHCPDVPGATELSGCAEQARELLANWRSPSLSIAVGLRESTLDEQAAAELRALLEGPPRARQPARSERRLPTADASIFSPRGAHGSEACPSPTRSCPSV